MPQRRRPLKVRQHKRRTRSFLFLPQYFLPSFTAESDSNTDRTEAVLTSRSDSFPVPIQPPQAVTKAKANVKTRTGTRTRTRTTARVRAKGDTKQADVSLEGMHRSSLHCTVSASNNEYSSQRRELSAVAKDDYLRRRLHSQIDLIQSRMDARMNALRLLQRVADRTVSQRIAAAIEQWRRVVALLSRQAKAIKRVICIVDHASELLSKEAGLRRWKAYFRKGRRVEGNQRRAAAKKIQSFFRMHRAKQNCFGIKASLHLKRVKVLRMVLLERMYKQGYILMQLQRNAAQRTIARAFRSFSSHQALLAERDREALERDRMLQEETLQRRGLRAIEIWRSSNAARIQQCFLACILRRKIEDQAVAACEIQRWFRSMLAIKKLRDAQDQAVTLLQRITRSHAARKKRQVLAEERKRCIASKTIQATYRMHISTRQYSKLLKAASRLQGWIRGVQDGLERKRVRRQRDHAAKKIQEFMVEMHSRRVAGRVIRRSIIFFLKRKRVLTRFTKLTIRVIVRELLFHYFRGVRGVIVLQRRFRENQAQRDLAATKVQSFMRKTLTENRREAAAHVIQGMIRRRLRQKMLLRVRFRVHVRLSLIERRAAITIQSAVRMLLAKRLRRVKAKQRRGVKTLQRKQEHKTVLKAFGGWKGLCEKARFEALARTEEEKNSAVTIQRFVRGWQLRTTMYKEAKDIADQAAYSNYLKWRETSKKKQLWEIHVAEHQRQESDSSALKRNIRQDILAAQAQEGLQAERELDAWQKILIPEEDPNHPRFEFYYYNPLTGQMQAAPPRGFIDQRRQKVAARGPPNPDELKWINLGWKRHVLSSERPFVYRNDYTLQESFSRPRGYVEEEEEEQTEADRAVCERCQISPCSIICDICSSSRFCRRCFFDSHRHPSLKTHATRPVFPAWKPPEDDPEEVLSIEEEDFDPDMCARCQKRENQRFCDDCGESYCSSCFDKAHAHGRLVGHKSRKWVAPEWEEFFDDEDGEVFYFNQTTKERSKEKPMELIFGWERRRLLENADLADQDRAEAAELEFLNKEIASLETFKSVTLKQARVDVEEFKAYKKETATTTKLAKLIAPSLAGNESSLKSAEVSSVGTEGSKRSSIIFSSAVEKKRKSQVKQTKREHTSQRFAKARKQNAADRLKSQAKKQDYMSKLLTGSKPGS